MADHRPLEARTRTLERRIRVLQLREKDHLTFRVIGETLGVDKERARQIYEGARWRRDRGLLT